MRSAFALLREAEGGEEESDIVAAGICLKAADTGRILMLQRSLDEDDDAAGTWEFPGGKLEMGEDPIEAAWREWQEEVGVELPESLPVVDMWESDNGVYQCFVVLIGEESFVDLSGGRATVNPDDPDGDQSEQSAWWTIEHARENPALREEVMETPWEKIEENVKTSMAYKKPETQWEADEQLRALFGFPPKTEEDRKNWREFR